MATIKIDADALFRAVVAHDYKLLAYYLDLRSGQITSRTLMPDEVQDVPRGPRVKPLPLLGGNLSTKKEDAPFGPVPVAKKTDLFKDNDGPKKESFEGDFWKREGKPKTDLFGGEGHRRESSTKKLAELFGEAAPPGEKKDPFAPVEKPTDEKESEPAVENKPSAEEKPTAANKSDDEFVAEVNEESPLQRIPPASLEQNLEWMRAFAQDCGDPKIRERLLKTLAAKKPIPAYERALRNYQRMNQQWERWYRKQAIHYAEAWLKAMPVEWEIVEPDAQRKG
jgi:hypothetical protein